MKENLYYSSISFMESIVLSFHIIIIFVFGMHLLCESSNFVFKT